MKSTHANFIGISKRKFTHRLLRNVVNKNKSFFQASILIMGISLQPIVQAAGVNSSVNDFFNNLGYNTNISAPSSFKGQTANYYNGGNVFVRSKVMTITLAKASLPSIELGCGGIDAFLGGFSHINSDQLIQFGKSVIANATPFAVDLALQTWAPSLKGIRDNLQNISDKWLNQSISSCETAQAAVEGLGAFASADVQKHLCSTIGTQNNTFSDWVGARQDCGAGGQSAPQLAAARNDPKMEDLTKKNHNLMWDALLKDPSIAGDKTFAEFMMGMSGTIIYDANGKQGFYPSLLADNDNMMNVLLNGGTTTRYKCDNTDAKKCLNVTKVDTSITTGQGLQDRVRTILDAIHGKIIADTELLDSEKSFLEYTSLPVLSFLMIATETNVSIDTDTYAQLIATELLTRYLQDSLNITMGAIKNTSVDPSDVKLMITAINNAKEYAKQISSKAVKKKNNIDSMIRNFKVQQNTINAAVSKNLQKNLSY